MRRTFSTGKKIYSVDMMFAYINIFNPPSSKIAIKELTDSLEWKGWGNPAKKNYYSARDVINDPHNQKYKDELRRIKNANLRYPIIMYGKNIVDGVHRLTKAYLSKKKYIKCYTFSSDIMKKFLVNTTGNWKKVDNLETSELIKLFHERFSLVQS